MRPEAILGFLFALAIGLVVSAIILRGAVGLYNRFVGGESSPRTVRMPPFGRALGIAAVNLVVTGVVGALVGVVIGALMGGGRSAASVAQFVSIPLGLVATVAVLTLMLPAPPRRSALVMLCMLLVYAVIALAVVAIVAVIAVAAR